MCSACGVEPKTTPVLFQCEKAARVWLLSPFRFRPEEMIRQRVLARCGAKKIGKNVEKWDTLIICNSVLEYMETQDDLNIQ